MTPGPYPFDTTSSTPSQVRGSSRPRDRALTAEQLEPFVSGPSFAHIIIFLRNGGERLEAVWLAKTVLGVPLGEALRWVDTVKLVPGKMPELLPEIPPRDYQPPREVSHWPPSVEEIVRGGGR